MKNPVRLCLVALLTLGGVPARAGVTFVVTSPVQDTTAGTEVFFSGTLTNADASAQLFLNDDQFVLTGSAPTLFVTDTNTFFANVPGILQPGGSYCGEIFSVTLSSTAPAGSYPGCVTLAGGTDIFATGSLASAGFTLILPGAGNIGANTVTLNDGVNPNGVDTTVTFQYGATTAYGQTTSGTDIGAGAGPVFVFANISGLQPGMTYHYRTVATSADGTVYNADQTFTTLPAIPAAPAWVLITLAILIVMVASGHLSSLRFRDFR